MTHRFTNRSILLGIVFSVATAGTFTFTPTAVHAGGNYCTTLGNPLLTTTMTQGYHGSHKSIDLKSSQGTIVRSAGSGQVINVTTPKNNAKKAARVAIVHDNGTKTEYMQLNKIAVKKGQFVSRGQVIGRSGGKPGTAGSYRSSGAHLHFALYNKDGKALNPTCVVQE